MNDGSVKFKNDQGIVEIGIGVMEFKCTGVTPPQDHPHIYLSMGADEQTEFVFDDLFMRFSSAYCHFK